MDESEAFEQVLRKTELAIQALQNMKIIDLDVTSSEPDPIAINEAFQKFVSVCREIEAKFDGHLKINSVSTGERGKQVRFRLDMEVIDLKSIDESE